MCSLNKSFFNTNGGLQIHYNVIGKDILYNAQKNPKNYLGLVVRIAGYSIYLGN
ncbi:MAG: glycine radical domain-containing protein [Promethearchaeota archaeon]